MNRRVGIPTVHAALAQSLTYRPWGRPAADASVCALSGLFSRFRKKPASDETAEEESINARAPRERFSSQAVGVISNYGDPAIQMALYRYLRSLGIEKVVYSGPIGILESPAELWSLIRRGEVLWVYGQAERPRQAPEVGLLPAGAEQIEVNGMLFRHFARSPETGEPIRFGMLQWPPPGAGQREAVEATVSGHDQRIIVIGSGLEYERWVDDPRTGRWELLEQNVPGYADTPIARIALPPEDRHAIIHPTSRSSYCSVIDPEQHRMALLML